MYLVKSKKVEKITKRKNTHMMGGKRKVVKINKTNKNQERNKEIRSKKQNMAESRKPLIGIENPIGIQIPAHSRIGFLSENIVKIHKL